MAFMMKVTVNRIDEGFGFEARNEEGISLPLDASSDLGGNEAGFRPMQLLLAGIGGCSGIDVVHMLRKQRDDIRAFGVQVEGERPEGEEPAPFTGIHLHFHYRGDLKREKVERAIRLSVEKYCSVARMLEDKAGITYSLEVKGEEELANSQEKRS